MVIPDGIEPGHLAKAVAEIERNGVPDERKSVHYDYVRDGKRYPPKYIISLAAKYAFGKELGSYDFNAVRARDYLRSRGHTVIDRRLEAAKLVQSEDDETSYTEGRELYRTHRSRERDSAVPKQAKVNRLIETGALECDVCGFNFEKTYGPLGSGFIEAHHTIPVSKLPPKAKTKLKDIALVCSNCHRMIHRQSKAMSISGLRKLIENHASNI